MYGTTRFTMLLVAALATLAPAALHAQDETAGRDEGKADPRARIEAALEAAARANIPVSLLESKVREGEAKRVPPERIAAAVEARLEALMRADRVLKDAAVQVTNDGELLLAAEALRAGVSETALIELSRTTAGERRAVATAVLTDLVRLGYASPNALARVSAALSGRAESLINLRAEAAASLRARGKRATDVPRGRRH